MWREGPDEGEERRARWGGGVRWRLEGARWGEGGTDGGRGRGQMGCRGQMWV